MILLDIIDPSRHHHHRPIRPIRNVVEDTIDTVRDTIDATKDAVADSVTQSQLILDNTGAAQSEASLLLPIVIVALALAGCLYLAYLYRRRRAAV